jgi:hypothetical protein
MAQLIESGIKTSDTLIFTGEGRVYSITLAFQGVTVGEFCTLVDGLTVAGHDEVAFVFPTANGTITKEWPHGKLFETGIFFNKGATAGSVYVEVSYR